MTLDAQSLRATWAVERLNLQPNMIAFSALPLTIDGASLYALVSNKSVALLIPVHENDLFGETRESNIEFIRSDADFGEGKRSYLQLSCLDESLERVFSNLCADLVNEVLSSSHPGTASRLFFDKWRILFSRSRSRLLSTNALTGLLGELTTLKQIVQLDQSRSIDYWVGPEGRMQDFVNGLARIEVKSTSNLNELKVVISGIHQLDVFPPDLLHLAVHRIIRDDSGSTLTDIINELVGLGIDRMSLYEKLSLVGYDATDPDLYKNEKFKVLETCWFEVNSEFPRIVGSSFAANELPSGVEDLKYSINLGMGEAKLEQEQIVNAINCFLSRAS